MSTQFDPTQSELNAMRLHKMIIELGYYGNDLVRVAQAYQEMKDTSGEKSHKAYMECKEALDSVISNFLSGKKYQPLKEIIKENNLEKKFGDGMEVIGEELVNTPNNVILNTLVESELLLEEEWGPANEAFELTDSMDFVVTPTTDLNK